MGYNNKTGNPQDSNKPLEIVGDEAKNCNEPDWKTGEFGEMI